MNFRGVPPGFLDLLEGLTAEVVRNRPTDITTFASEHFENLLKLRGNTEQEILEDTRERDTDTREGNHREHERLLSQAGGSGGLMMELAANEKAVHSDFFNDFDDLFDDEDLS
ncbi:sperm surface protein Sp17-like [Branchiostoma floridae]|uniref:COP9 signalosome complex subunit 9 n=1 Tax=Branchiostoma floridae TaxID=7739 RepID=A0A9J7M055_BRAFL|nr:sperm surface protein Sp17-like [Branchiostoma floridae]